jgi:beta-glucanase (GH16 family)
VAARFGERIATGTFWLLGGSIDEVGWPRCGEIDIMEGKGRLDDWTLGAIHRGRPRG